MNQTGTEYFSEDPYLAGTMAGIYSKGMEQVGTVYIAKEGVWVVEEGHPHRGRA